MKITIEQLKRIAPLGKPSLLSGFCDTLNNEGKQWGLTAPLAIMHFVAQCAHESDGFRTFEEYASGDMYDTRTDLGNTSKKDGDGRHFKGRGPIQITGRTNYEEASEAIGVDYVKHPEWAAGPVNGTRIAMWYWWKRDLTRLALIDDIFGITKKINGGINGLEARKKYLERAKRFLTPMTNVTVINKTET
jgi:Predicted chitinase